MSRQNRTPRRNDVRLTLTQLEDRTTPAVYAVGMLSPATGDAGESAATFTGGIELNSTLPAQDGKAVVTAADPTAAIQAALVNTVTATVGGQSATYQPGPTTVTTTTTAQLPFVVTTSTTGEYVLHLEDLSNMPGSNPDWDYNDRTWTVTVVELTTISVATPTPGEESADGSRPVVVELTRTNTTPGSLDQPLYLPFTLSGTASPGVDYQLPSALIAVFWPGELTTRIVLPVIADPEPEDPELVIVHIDPPVGVAPDPIDTTITIHDPGTLPPVPPVPPAPTLPEVWVSGSLDGEERSDGLRPVVFQLSRTNPSDPATAPALTVGFSLTGVATGGDDYTEPSAYTATFAPGALTTTVVLSVVYDDVEEVAEAAVLTLTPSSAYTLTSGIESDWANIYDYGTTPAVPPPPPVVWITADQNAHEQGEQVGWFTVHRSSGVGTLTVAYSAPGGTATWGADYFGTPATGGAVTFADGEREKRVLIQPVADTIDEDTETVSLHLLPPSQPGPDGRPQYVVRPPVRQQIVQIKDRHKVTVEVVDAGSKKIDKLRVGRWDDAFKRKAGQGVEVELRPNFISRDKDAFWVKVTDSAANQNSGVAETITITAKVDSFAMAREMTLTETGVDTGVFESKSLLLTMIEFDDAYEVDNVANGAKDDRTFLIQKLGEGFTAAYKNVSDSASTTLEKVVKLHINFVRDTANGDSNYWVAGVTGWEKDETKIAASILDTLVKFTNQVYAPTGIRFEVVGGKVNFVNPPVGDGLDYSDSLEGWSVVDGKVVLSAEEKALLGDANLRTKDTTDVEVYFVSDLKVNDVNLPNVRGEALNPKYSPDAKYNNSVVIGKVGLHLQVLAHELGHILLDEHDHLTWDQGVNVTRLMADDLRARGEPTDSLRFTEEQAKSVSTQSKELLHDPSK